MFFRFRYVVRHFGISRAPNSIEIDLPEPQAARISLHQIGNDELKKFYEKDDWVALVSTEEPVTDKVMAQFDSSADPPPQAVAEVSRRASTRINSALTHFLQIVRWRNGFYGDHKLLRCTETGLLWSADGNNWRPVPGQFSCVASDSLYAVPFNEGLLEQLKNMLISGEHEPLGHELLREAWNLQHDSPRSALVLGVAALEVGVKAFVSKLVPDAEWLCFEMPTPPVIRILNEYLPKLPVRLRLNNRVFVPESVLVVLKKAIEQRNRVIHKGTDNIHSSSLSNILTNIQMALYFLDYYSGYSWALSNMREESVYELVASNLKQQDSGTANPEQPDIPVQ